MAASPQQVRDALENYVKAWGTNDKALLMSIIADDAVFRDPVGAPPIVGREAIARFWDAAHAGGVSLSPALQEIRAGANEGILRFVSRLRVPEKNQGIDLSIIEHFELDDGGKIKTMRAFWDETNVARPDGMELFVPDVAELNSR